MSGGLDEYAAKRDFGRTPEPAPAPARPRPGEAVFVIHRHEARRLHYDLRLEMDGVLKSWAVPKGFSYDPADKHLAVRTEDHPIEYETFEGMIPKGEYGAGTMTIWDHGHYRMLTEGDWAAQVETGKFEIVCYGKRLRGEWHCVRTKENWLLFKARDRHARAEGVLPLSMNLDAAHTREMPARAPRPMTAGPTVEPFSDPGWVFEMLFAGRRLMARVRDGQVGFAGAAGRGVAEAAASLVDELGKVRADDAYIDGVLVAMDATGRPDGALLERVLAGGAEATVAFYAFDLLHYDRWDLRPLPLLDRKAALVAVLGGRQKSLLYVDHVTGRGVELAQSVKAAGLPGVVAKRSGSAYSGGSSQDWRRFDLSSASAAPAEDVQQALRRQTAGARRRPARVELSNLDKVYWPAEGYTKGDLLAYYEEVADVVLPYLHERPIHLYRWPDGIEGKNFYQQNAPDGCPDWVATEWIQRRHKEEPVRHMVCNDRDTLLYLINLGSIDLHPWMSRRSALESPDYAVIDFDPKAAPFQDVVKLARETGKLLRGIGLRPLVKTSGSTGLHVYVPLVDGYSYDQARMFCEGVCRVVASEHKDIATVERSMAARGRRVYLDFMQNRRGQTIVPPYTVRPVRGGTVSTPLHWDELSSDLALSDWTLLTVPDRVAQHGDLFRPLLEDRQDLMPAIEALQRVLRGG